MKDLIAFNNAPNRVLMRLLGVTSFVFTITAFSQTAAASCNYVVTEEWDSGFSAEIRIKNETSKAVDSWKVTWSYANSSLTSHWNATVEGNNPYTATNATWNGSLAPGGSTSIGLQGNTSKGVEKNINVSGSICGSESSSSTSSSTSSSSSSSGSADNSQLPCDKNALVPEIADYYVSPKGKDSNPGTIDYPFATAAKAQSVAGPGDLIYFRGGRYIFDDLSTDIGVLFNKSGRSNQRIRYWAYPGETPIFDFNKLVPKARIRGFAVRANWLHFKGLELTGVQQILTDVNESWGIRVENGASNNIFEYLNIHHNEGPGLFIADGGNNLVLNVDSHHNYDPDRGGENADGFGCHSNDPGNVFRGSRAWYNSDDGFDFIHAPAPCTVEYSMAFYNGYIPDTKTKAGNGSGIKAGGYAKDKSRTPSVVPRHIVRFNITAGNRISGFYANHHPGGIDWIHNTAYNNPLNFDMLADAGAANHLLRNNVALSPGTALANATKSEIDDWANAWSEGITVRTSDFESVKIEDALGARNADGSLPAPVFLYPSKKSVLINKGVDTSVSPSDSPDLGAYEYGNRDTCYK